VTDRESSGRREGGNGVEVEGRGRERE